jgi:hypothetical protein
MSHLEAVSKVFFSRPSTVNQANWAQHMLCELISFVPNVMLDKLGRKLEDMMQQPQSKRMRYNVPDTLYVVYSEHDVCSHILGMWSTVDKIIDVYNEMMAMIQARHVGSRLTPEVKALINMLSTLHKRIHNLQFLLSRTCWHPSFFLSPRMLAPQPKMASLCSQPEPRPLAPSVTDQGLSFKATVKVEPAPAKDSGDAPPPMFEAISDTIKKECSHLPCPGGAPCLST